MLITALAKLNGIQYSVKGVRNSVDFDYEQQLHMIGESLDFNGETCILFANPTLAHVSSSTVKGILLEQGAIEDYVPLNIKQALEQRLLGQTIVGVTGSIASGKSTLCGRLVAMGEQDNVEVHHLDLDKLGHNILADTATPIARTTQAQLIGALGAQITIQGTISREKLSAVIFSDIEARQVLNSIMKEPIQVYLRQALRGRKGLILVEGALLAEADTLRSCNNTLIVTSTPEHQQMRRLQARELSETPARQRIQAQWSCHHKTKTINHSIQQNGFGKLWQIDTQSDRAETETHLLYHSLVNLHQHGYTAL